MSNTESTGTLLNYRNTQFLTSAARMAQLDIKENCVEIAFAGRSNAGKSSALNTLTEQKNLARTSKTPGRTQLINIFEVDESCRLVDLPGYGFAKVSEAIKAQWQETLSEYLQQRDLLKGLILLMDIRHPFKDTDDMLIRWSVESNLPIHILLTKADKLKRGAQKNALLAAKKQLTAYGQPISIQTFSSLKKEGLDELKSVLNQWFKQDLASDSE